MLKRVYALFFILLASFVLLANVIVPHHHHENEVCVVSSHCETESCTDEKDDGHGHGHDGENSIENCILNPVFVIPTNQVKQEIKSLDFSEKGIINNQLQSNIVPPDIICLQSSNFDSTKPSLIFSLYCHYMVKCLGMRSSPIV